jgi:hypothetical protein
MRRTRIRGFSFANVAAAGDLARVDADGEGLLTEGRPSRPAKRCLSRETASSIAYARAFKRTGRKAE